VVVIACAVMEQYLVELAKQFPNVTVRFLDQGLHRTPKKLRGIVQEHIDKASKYAARIILGYGLCSNGITGIEARRQEIIIPRSHDCLSFFLGSPNHYLTALKERPGTYYMTSYWIEEKCDPLGVVELDYTPRVGYEMAVWFMQEELKHYTHMIIINTRESDSGPVRKRAIANSEFFEKQYGEVSGSLEYFNKLLKGPYTKEEFILLKPGEAVTMDMFFERP
jgi:hypothetical protein